MASENLGELIVSISSDISKLQKGLTDAQKATKDTENITGKSTALIAGLWVAAATAVVGALGAMIKSSVDYGDEIYEASQRTGIATETLSKLKFVAEQTESSFEAVTNGFKFLNKAMFEATNGNTNLSLAFQYLGVKLRDAKGNIRDTESVFLDLSDQFKNMEDGSRKTALAMQIFGRNGTALIPVLNLGKQGIEELSKEAEKLGLVLTADNAKKIDEYSDNVKKMKAAFGGLSLELTNAVLPALSKFTEWITEGIKKIKEFNDAGGLLGKRGASLTDQNLTGPDPEALSGRGQVNNEIELQKIIISNKDIQAQAHEQKMQQIAIEQTALDQQIAGLKNFASQVQSLGQTIQGAFSTALSSLILQGGKAKEIFQALGQTLVQAIVDFVAQQIIAVTIGRVIRAAETALLTAMGLTVASAWAPAAAFVSLASFGSNAAPAGAALTSITSLARGLAIGFAEGTDTVPAMLSPGEMIVPRSFTDAIKSGDLTLGGRGGNDNSRQEINITVEATINQMLDIQKVAEEIAFQTSRELRYIR